MPIAVHICRSRLRPDAAAAGLNLCANLPPEQRAAGLAVAPGARALALSGLAPEIPLGHEVELRPRSGPALRQGLTLLNAPGTIDSDYSGEAGVILISHGAEPGPWFACTPAPAGGMLADGARGGGFGVTGIAARSAAE